ncbi:MAG: PAS domain S-box protein [Anaerolineae bacterium]|nr:PAS domain S-box protein [Gemmatimonadaceae bacterium]
MSDSVTGNERPPPDAAALAERHRRVIETASDAIVITDPDRRIAFCNPAAGELFGMDCDSVVGTPVSHLTPPEFREDVSRRETSALNGQAQRYETVIARSDGERRMVAVTTAPLRENGEITGVVASLRDITDERRARDAVVQSEARYRNLFETASDAIYTLDPHGDFTSLNHATCEITGFPPGELLGRSMLPFLDSGDVAGVSAHFVAVMRGKARKFECHYFTRSGVRRTASVTHSPITHADTVVGVLGIARDVTVEREREAALSRSEASYGRLVDSAYDAIFTVDADMSFTSVNKALERAIGLSREELIGLHFGDFIDPVDRRAMREIFEAAMAGQLQRGEFRFQDSERSLRTGSLTATPIFEKDRIAGVLCIVRDVTEERRLGLQLLQREKLAAIGQLVSGVAHELNNPLAGIMAFSQLLLATNPTSPDQLDALVTINAEAKRAAKIISNLLLFARQRHPERSATDLNQVLRDALELRRYALLTHQIDIVFDLDASLPPALADASQLQQVFLNLIANAEHALRDLKGLKRITLKSSRSDYSLTIAIADNGPGIPASVMDRVFEPFYTTKSIGDGTGLGLSISDGIVREHGGQIRVKSCEGEGTEFTVELPLAGNTQQTE